MNYEEKAEELNTWLDEREHEATEKTQIEAEELNAWREKSQQALEYLREVNESNPIKAMTYLGIIMIATYPPEWLAEPLQQLRTRIKWKQIEIEYQELRQKGYLKKNEALQILSDKYGLKKSTVERIAYTGTSYKP